MYAQACEVSTQLKQGPRARFTQKRFGHGLRLERCHFFSARPLGRKGLKIGTGPSTGVSH